jgi:hypothetical protein
MMMIIMITTIIRTIIIMIIITRTIKNSRVDNNKFLFPDLRS